MKYEIVYTLQFRKWNCKNLMVSWKSRWLSFFMYMYQYVSCLKVFLEIRDFWEPWQNEKNPRNFVHFLFDSRYIFSVYCENGLHVLWFVILLCSMYQHIRQSKWSQSRQWVYRQRTSAEWCQRSTRSGASRIWWTTSWRPWKSQYTSLPTKPVQ